MSSETSYTYRFERAKRGFFVALALDQTVGMQIHRQEGQFRRVSEAEKSQGALDMRPAVRHCLVEAARATVLADMIGLEGGVKADLVTAAVVHDAQKAREIVRLRKDPSLESFDKAREEARTALQSYGVLTDRQIAIAQSVAHDSAVDISEVLGQGSLTDLDKAKLSMHYIDDYTRNDLWAVPTGEDGNDLDRRMVKNEQNPLYAFLNEEGRAHFSGQTTFEMQREVGHKVEQRLADLTLIYSGTVYMPLDLPVAIDAVIKDRIDGLVQ